MATETKATPGTAASGGASSAPAAATLKQLRDASNAIVDALQGLGRDDQSRALESATSLLGLRRKQGAPNQQSGAPQGRGGGR